MRKISLILAIVMIFSVMLSFAACEKDGEGTDTTVSEEKTDISKEIAPKDAVLKDMVAKITEKAPYEEYVSEILYKEEDPDEMVKWTYGLVDINAESLLSDYVITMHSDYAHTLAILKFKDGMTEDDFAEVKDIVTEEYLEARRSALAMYMPEEADIAEWAVSNPDKVWRQYGDNMLVLAVYGEGEPTAVWNAIDAYLKGESNTAK